MSLKSSLQIKAGFRSGKTFLKESYATPPFKVADVTEDKTSSLLRLMIMSSSPGILDNDTYTFEIDVEENARLRLTTQGFQRIFKMKSGASQEVNIKLGDGASFFYLPHPTVPHEDADFTSLNNVSLSRNHSFIWSEIITCGRKHNGEVFKFKRYQNKTKIFIEDKLAVLENILLLPVAFNLLSIGQMEGYSHQSSFIYLDSVADMKLIAEEIYAFLTLQPDIACGISALAVNGFVIRMLGFSGEKLFKLQNDIADRIAVLSANRLTQRILA